MDQATTISAHLPVEPPFLAIMSTYQGSSNWAEDSSYTTGEAPPRRRGTHFLPILEDSTSSCERPVGQARTPRSPNSTPPRSAYHDVAATPPLNTPEPMPRGFVNVLLGNHEPRLLFYDVTQPPNTAFVFSESQQAYKQISLRKSKQPVLINPTQRTYTLEFEHPAVGRQFISTFEPTGTVLSLLSGIYEYFQEKLSAPEFALLSQMGDIYQGAQMSMRARRGHDRSSRIPNNGVRKVDFLGEHVMLQGVELDLDGRGRPSVLLIKFATRSG
jgi:hypothetical protein